MTKRQLASGLLAICAALEVGSAAARAQAPGAGGRGNIIELAGERVIKGDVAGALALLQAAERADPLLPPARLMLARLCFNVPGPARQHGRAELERALAESPDHPAGHLTNAGLALNDGLNAEAILSAEKAMQLADAPRWTEAQRRGFRVTGRTVLATAFERRGDWPAAHAHTAALVELDGGGRHRARLAKAQFFLDKPDDALAAFRRAAADDASVEPPALQMARLWSVKGDAAKARGWFDAAVRDGPKDVRVRIAYAEWLLTQQDAAGAVKQVESAEAIDSRSPAVLKLRERLKRSDAPQP